MAVTMSPVEPASGRSHCDDGLYGLPACASDPRPAVSGAIADSVPSWLGGLPKDAPPRRGTPECDAWQKKRAVSQNRYFATAVGDRAVHATDDLKIGKLYRLGFSGHRGPSDRSTDRRGANQRILLSRGKLGPEKPRVGQQARGAGQYLFATLDSSVQ